MKISSQGSDQNDSKVVSQRRVFGGDIGDMNVCQANPGRVLKGFMRENEML